MPFFLLTAHSLGMNLRNADTPNSSIYVIGTLDTKGHELAFVADCVRDLGASALLVDVGTGAPPQVPAAVEREVVASFHPGGKAVVFQSGDRGQAITAMSEALTRFLLHEFESKKIGGVIGLGGTGGTALISPSFRALPIGLPKLLVSTVASGNTGPYVGTSDFTMVNSVVDVAGLNRVSREVLANAAHAIAGMVLHRRPATQDKPTLGMTMFGVTTPCVDQVRIGLESSGWDCLVFHATGSGGQAMEKLAASGMLKGLLDLTTTEVADEVVGGVFRAGTERFDHLAVQAIPCVMSLGALDMVNFGAMETVPPAFRQRKLHVHNAHVTLMRTTPEENRLFAQWICQKINRARGPLTLLIPEKGVSSLDMAGKPFYDPEADETLFAEVTRLFQETSLRRLMRLPFHINDPEFATAAIGEFNRLTSLPSL